MSTVYVKVSTAINYPPVGHEVLWLNQNGEVFKGKLEEFEDNHSWVNCVDGQSLSVFDFEYWLDERVLPSEEEIKPESKYAHEFYQNGFKDGANHILNLLNPPHNEQ